MDRVIYAIALLLPVWLHGQPANENIRTKSYQTFVYKINAATADKFIRKDSIDLNAFLNEHPFTTLQKDNEYKTTLPNGNYVFISIDHSTIRASFQNVSNLYAYTVNNRKKPQLLIIDKTGHFIENAKVWVNNKPAHYNQKSKSYLPSQKNFDDAYLKVYATNDTLFSGISANDDLSYSITQQRWSNFKNSKFAKVISWPWRTVTHLFQNKPSYNQDAAGMILFNQPKYKKTDTVKLKAYMYNKRLKMYDRPVYVFLEYSERNKFQSTLIKKLSPTSAGSFQLEFPLSDTLTANNNYIIQFKNSKGKNLLRSTFKIEDYLLDDIVDYNFRSAKAIHFPNDSIQFYAFAKDANGLSILDVKATLTLRVNNIVNFFKDTIYIPDTLIVEEKKLEAEGDTKFIIPTDILKDATVDLTANLQFINSNNEVHEKETNLKLVSVKNELTSLQSDDTLAITYRENGKIAVAEGLMIKEDEWNDTLEITYPYKVKIDPMAYAYTFYLTQNKNIIDSVKVEPQNYDVSIQQINHGDTLGFNLNNPYAIPVTFTVFYGNKIIGKGLSSEKEVQWRRHGLNNNRIYNVSWQYRWAGEEQVRQDRIAVYDKLLNIDVNSNSTVFPGQKDTITIYAKDYKNKPINNINLTAFAYNNQFARDINVPEPPYLKKFAFRQSINRDTYEEECTNVISSFRLGDHQEWRNKFSIDSMLYYKMAFPSNGFINMPTPISDYMPQISIHTIKNGEWQPASMLYINRQLVYYSDVTHHMKDVYRAQRGYVLIGIRLPDRFIEIDSIYLQPYYKHDFFIDIYHLPSNAKVTLMPAHLTDDEKSLLRKSLLVLDETNNGGLSYLWQRYQLVTTNGPAKYILGPFRTGDSLHYFRPGRFDIHFPFEPGYEYRLSKKIARLEKTNLFDDHKYVLNPKTIQWQLGDTLDDLPEIHYDEPYIEPSLTLSPTTEAKEAEGKLLFTLHRDSAIKYAVLYPVENANKKIVSNGNKRLIDNIAPGDYTLMLIDRYWRTLEVPHIRIIENKTLCLHTEHIPFKVGNPLLWKWWNETLEPVVSQLDSNHKATRYEPQTTTYPRAPLGNATITGKVIDQDGKLPITGATIIIKGSSTGASTDMSGRFTIRNVRAGTYILDVFFVGYQSKELTVEILQNNISEVNVQLKAQENNLQEVIVTAYGISREKKGLSYSFATISQAAPLTALAGKVPGVQVQNRAPSILLRGVTSITNKPQQLYVIDGILYDELPANISGNMISNVSVLNEAVAVALYGSRAANGAIVITTNSGNASRKLFRDYAFWQPKLFTDKNGEAKFVVEYPDNITGWRLYVLGMDKKRRIGKTVRFIESYKPVWAELNLPRFLIEGDSAELVGKSVNYSADAYSVNSTFRVNGMSPESETFLINPKESVIKKHLVSTSSADTMSASFHITSTTGFKDGEEQQIPVLKKGILQTDGNFWLLQRDTTIRFQAPVNNETIEIFAQNNTLDLLLNEIDGLKKYPYTCNEQKASKLKGLLMEKQIMGALHQKFNDDKTIEVLLGKILKAQQYDGGWGWWEGGNSNIYITNYVLKALLLLRDDANVEAHLRNGLLYLQNHLEYMTKEELLATLVTMSRARHAMDYDVLMKRFEFDSLNMHQQWEWLMINQFIKTDYSSQLRKIINKGTKQMLGGLHWGEENYSWFSNEVATTVLAFEVLMKEGNNNTLLDGMLQYFLGMRKSGYWRNTVESASIVSTVLPYILSQDNDFNRPSILNVSGDTTFAISKFPFELSIKNSSIKNLSVRKTGGGLIYLTIYQNHWNTDPAPVSKYYQVQTRFERNNKTLNVLGSGEKVTMVVDIKTEKEADYVMIEIPIPAGCVYGKNETSSDGLHRELLKDKVLLFSEHMTKGNHHFTIELEPRYNGRYTLNPSKVSLMYFPTFYGRNEMRQVNVAAPLSMK